MQETYDMPIKQYIIWYKSDLENEYHRQEVNDSAHRMTLEVDDLCNALSF